MIEFRIRGSVISFSNHLGINLFPILLSSESGGWLSDESFDEVKQVLPRVCYSLIIGEVSGFVNPS